MIFNLHLQSLNFIWHNLVLSAGKTSLLQPLGFTWALSHWGIEEEKALF